MEGVDHPYDKNGKNNYISDLNLRIASVVACVYIVTWLYFIAK
jgi:hypothetical protein